jgi:hypothetical protein
MVKKRKGRKAAPLYQIPPPPPLPVIRKQLKKATAAHKPVPSSTSIPAPTHQHSVPTRAGPARQFQDSRPAVSPQQHHQRPAKAPVQPQASTPPPVQARAAQPRPTAPVPGQPIPGFSNHFGNPTSGTYVSPLGPNRVPIPPNRSQMLAMNYAPENDLALRMVTSTDVKCGKAVVTSIAPQLHVTDDGNLCVTTPTQDTCKPFLYFTILSSIIVSFTSIWSGCGISKYHFSRSCTIRIPWPTCTTKH